LTVPADADIYAFRKSNMTPGKKQRQAARRAAVKEVKEVPECLSEEK
jgi:hypothetical protein